MSISSDIKVRMSRTALLINCAESQAQEVRQRAHDERRTISGYVLTVAMRAIGFEQRFFGRIQALGHLSNRRAPGPRTCLLIRCSGEEARRIRAAAKRRQMTICGYVLNCLERTWSTLEANAAPVRARSQASPVRRDFGEAPPEDPWPL
jgi:hypothetical protein